MNNLLLYSLIILLIQPISPSTENRRDNTDSTQPFLSFIESLITKSIPGSEYCTSGIKNIIEDIIDLIKPEIADKTSSIASIVLNTLISVFFCPGAYESLEIILVDFQNIINHNTPEEFGNKILINAILNIPSLVFDLYKAIYSINQGLFNEGGEYIAHFVIHLVNIPDYYTKDTIYMMSTWNWSEFLDGLLGSLGKGGYISAPYVKKCRNKIFNNSESISSNIVNILLAIYECLIGWGWGFIELWWTIMYSMESNFQGFKLNLSVEWANLISEILQIGYEIVKLESNAYNIGGDLGSLLSTIIPPIRENKGCLKSETGYGCLSPKCFKVLPNYHHSNILNIPFPTRIYIKTRSSITAKVRMDKNMAEYFIPNSNPSVRRCEGSWNKLFGASRCMSYVHKDSDRFVWRRAQSCLNYTGENITIIPNCKDKGKMEVAAYAYDDYLKPFQNIGTLLKPFNTLLDVQQWYYYELQYLPTYTIYNLYDQNYVFLERNVIQHRECGLYAWGYTLEFFFGGYCAAPQEVSACYNYIF